MQPPSDRDPVRRLRGRLGGAVTLWTSAHEGERAGLTVSSLMIAGGEPGRILGLIDPDSDLCEVLTDSGRAVVQLLLWEHHQLADVFAGTVPAPGGQFAQASWEETEFGPLLSSVTSWVGVHLESAVDVGWSKLMTATIERTVIGDDLDALVHRRGRYQSPSH